MSQIDWSKARDGFDFHFKPRVGNDAGGFYMVSPLNDRFVGDLGNYILFRDMSDVAGLFIVTTRPELAPWTGEGLSPVGTVCDVIKGSVTWYESDKQFIGKRCVVRSVFKTDFDVEIAAVEFADGCCLALRVDLLQAIRTPEQIAAEERRKSAIALYEAVMNFGKLAFDRLPLDRQEHYLKLVDAGWQKVKS